MERDRTTSLDPDHFATSRNQLESQVAYLRRLWLDLQCTASLIARATTRYKESRILLEQIDGAPYSPVIGQIHLPD
jgi:hypothetical protein